MWIYGICDQAAPPEGQGLADAPLEAHREGGLTAVFTRHAERVGAPEPAALWAHEQVVERLMADCTVVPMRFGSTVAGEDALRDLLAERREELTAALARVRGRIELGVRALAQPPAAHRSGRDYLLARLRASRHADALHEPLARLAADAVRRPPRGAGELLRGAYLVDGGEVVRFRAGVEDLQDAHPELTIHCTGPWPAYSFVAS
jgi:hypothetical protein